MRGAFELCNADFYQRFNLDLFNHRDYGKSVVDLVDEIAFHRDEVLENCVWADQPINNCKYFRPVITSEGLCYSFNTLNSREIFSNKYAI